MFGAGTPQGSESSRGTPDADPTAAAGVALSKVSSPSAGDQAASPPTATTNLFKPSVASEPFRQGEILTGVRQHRRSILSLKSQTHELEEIQHPYAVVMSPDCDLEQDFTQRMGEAVKGGSTDRSIPDILLLQATTADELRATAPAGKDIWKRIRQNKDERYHVIERVRPEQDAVGTGLAALGIDFKRYFTVPTDELYLQCEATAKRRCHLETPYSEHLNRRFTDFLSRVALPREHQVE